MNSYRWAAPGDVNAFFGLMLDNIAGMVLTVELLYGVFGFPVEFTLRFLLPGTALGVLVGDLLFTWMAFRLAKKTENPQVTAMPLGLDTPSTIGLISFVVGPAYLSAGGTDGGEAAASYAWQIGMCALIVSGVFKIAAAAGAQWVRRAVPRAGLLGSLAAIALVLISFFPLLDIVAYPVAGFASLAVILTTLTARIKLPGKLPGALVAVVIGSVIYYAMDFTGTLGHEPKELPFEPQFGLFFPWPTLAWLAVFQDSLTYLPVVIPFALATIIGGIDCTESAAAAGDEYDTRSVVAVEGVATLIAGLCGGVIQTTPYIGHPAYKAMGGRAAYTLATALFVGGAGILGYFGFLYALIPKAAIYPILIFIGLEITAQSFEATPKRHYSAVALACVPALAYLVISYGNRILAETGTQLTSLSASLAEELQTLQILSGGFIVTSLLWAGALAALVDRRLRVAAAYFAVCGACSLFGIIHSPLANGRMLLPFAIGGQPATELPEMSVGQGPIYMAVAYVIAALIVAAWSPFVKPIAAAPDEELMTDA